MSFIWDGTFTEDEADMLEDGIMLLKEFTSDADDPPAYEFPAIKGMRSVLDKVRRSLTVRSIPDVTR